MRRRRAGEDRGGTICLAYCNLGAGAGEVGLDFGAEAGQAASLHQAGLRGFAVSIQRGGGRVGHFRAGIDLEAAVEGVRAIVRLEAAVGCTGAAGDDIKAGTAAA